MIKQAIFDGRLNPGERIIELELSKQLGISNTAVREALFELQRQGYVKRHPNRGTFVTELTQEDAEQIFAVRKELEGLAAELVKGRLTEADVAALSQTVETMREAAARLNPEMFSKADLDFHQTIWRLSRNRVLEEMLVNVVGPMFAVFLMRGANVNQQELFRNAAERRQVILDSLIRGRGSRRVMEDAMKYFRQQRMRITFQAEQQETPRDATAAPKGRARA